MRTRSLILFAVIAPVASIAILGTPLGSHAQTIEADVGQHVKESLKKEQADANKKRNTPKKSAKKPPKSQHRPKQPSLKKNTNWHPDAKTIQWNSKEPPKDNRTNLPKRVLHRYFKLDPKLAAAYRAWIPRNYPNVNTSMTNYFVWQLNLSGRLFDLINLAKGRYESNGLASPRHPYRKNAARYGKWGVKAAWFLVELGIPIMNAWEPVIRYETRAFWGHAKTRGGHQVCIVDYNTPASTPTDQYCQGNQLQTELSQVSSFESAMVGVTYHPSRVPGAEINPDTSNQLPVSIGVAYLSYVKPYQVRIGDYTLNDFLFSARLFGGGLALGTRFGGGINRLGLSLWTQFGLGGIKILKDLTLNELAPSDWLIGYIQGNVNLSFKWAPFKFAPTILIVPQVEASGADFFFFETKREPGDAFTMPSVNWDILYKAQLSLIVTL